MSIRTLLILAVATMAFILISPVKAAPPAQFGPDSSTTAPSTSAPPTGDQATVQDIVVDSTGAFTLTIKIDEVTTVAIPLRVNWRAQGPLAGDPNQVSVVISPTVLETGIFPVIVSAIEPTTGTLALTLTQPAVEIAPLEPITETPATTTTIETAPEATPTVPVTSTAPVTNTAPVTSTAAATAILDPNAPRTNTVANLRSGPGTDYAVVATIPAEEPLNITGRNEDGSWYQLASGSWVASFLVTNPPQGVPVAQPAATPLPPTVAPVATTAPAATPIPTASLVITPTVAP